MASYELLDQPDEDALHAARLLNVEEKLFKRVTKRLLTPGSLVLSPQDSLPTPPPDESTDAESATNKEGQLQRQLEQRRKWEEDVYLDFAAFDSNIVRAQLLLNSNERERSRYAEEKVRILETAQAVRDTNASLHDQLKEAQRTLEVRKGYDELAEKITSNRMLKTRDEQHVQLEKLNAEIADLERESKEYAKTWAERRVQFGRIIEETNQMLRLIRDEKEEAERKEGMEAIETGEDREASPSRGDTSQVATPAGGATPAHVSEGTGKSSPSHGSKLRDEILEKDPVDVEESQATSPAPPAETQEPIEPEDSQMINNEDITTESEAMLESDPRRREVDTDMAQIAASNPESAATETSKADIEIEQMDTT